MLNDVGFTRGVQLPQPITVIVMINVMLSAQMVACRQHLDEKNITR